VCTLQDVLSELFKSAEIHDRAEVSDVSTSSDSKQYRRQLTVEELFKGVFNSLFIDRRSASILG